MKRAVFLSVVLLFAGCSAVEKNVKKVKSFTKCYIDKIPAPFWVCYQSNFMSVGKVYTKTPSRLIQEEAYSKAINDLIQKLQTKTEILLKKANINNKEILKKIKNFVIVNAIEGDSWFDKKNHILYVQASIDKDEFKNFLKQQLKIKNFEKLFYETF